MNNFIVYCFWFFLSLLIYSYFIYPLFLLILVKIYKKSRIIDEKIRPTVSIITSAYNEESVIEEKILNFKKLNYPDNKIELIIGSDGSTDKTKSILLEYRNKNIIPYIYKSRSGKATILNRLTKKAKGNILIFSDANTMFDKNAIINLTRHFVNADIGGVCGNLILEIMKNENSDSGEQIYWRYENRIKKLEGKIKTVFGANGGIYALRKELYTPLTDKKFLNDDFIIPLYPLTKGYDIIYDEESKGFEKTSRSLSSEFSRKVRIGVGNYNALGEIKSLLKFNKGFISFGLWSHKIIRWFAPFIIIVIFISNLFLLNNPFYFYIWLIQVLLYILSIVGFILESQGKYIKLLLYPYYFYSLNFALFIGFFKYLNKSQKLIWEPSKRK